MRVTRAVLFDLDGTLTDYARMVRHTLEGLAKEAATRAGVSAARFIEVYDDPLGMKASWESVVNFKDLAATKRADAISANAQWFEDRSPVDARFKKKEVKGVSAKVITAAMLGGACYPSTPIGINLPNANWIRKNYGSKSVTRSLIFFLNPLIERRPISFERKETTRSKFSEVAGLIEWLL